MINFCHKLFARGVFASQMMQKDLDEFYEAEDGKSEEVRQAVRALYTWSDASVLNWITMLETGVIETLYLDFCTKLLEQKLR